MGEKWGENGRGKGSGRREEDGREEGMGEVEWGNESKANCSP